MNKKVRARVTWLKPEEGGRKTPPRGSTYSTAARFDAIKHRWPAEAWSIVVELPEDSGQLTMDVDVRLLAEEGAPAGLLDPGSAFDLFEGRTLVARGIVL